jgi:hypothetical protein
MRSIGRRLFRGLLLCGLLALTITAKAAHASDNPIVKIIPMGCANPTYVYEFGSPPTCEYVVQNNSTGLVPQLKIFPGASADLTVITPTVPTSTDHCTGQTLTPAGTGSTSQCNFTVAVGFTPGSPGGQTILSPVVCMSNGLVCSNVLLANRITVIALGGQTAQPQIQTISPAIGSAAGGGSPITITGQNLGSASSVTFGSAPATILTNTDNTITVTLPVSAVSGPVNVTVTTAGGSSVAVNGFTYTPFVASVTPSGGPLTPTSPVTVAGNGFQNATSISFGSNSLPVTSPTATSISVTPPGVSTGATVPVVVTAATQVSNSNVTFTYSDAPTITAVYSSADHGAGHPAAGPIAGGDTVTITGTNFIAGTTVTFGSGTPIVPAIITPTELTVIAPAHVADVLTVTVTTTGGAVTGGAGQDYTYLDPPTISSLTSTANSGGTAAGPTAGGDTVSLHGTNYPLTATGIISTVTFAANAGTGVDATASTLLTVDTPAHAAGAVDVTLTTPGGTVTSTGGYTYDAAPTILTINPNQGPSTGGTPSVTITGTNFTKLTAGTTTVTFGGTPGTSVVVANDGQSLTVTPPAHAGGSVNVVVQTPGGSATQTNGYTYIGPPSITSVTSQDSPAGPPAAGPTVGGDAVTINGTNFVSGQTTVTIGGLAAAVSTMTTTSITVTSPPHAAGVVNVVVTTPTAPSATATNAYTYLAVPTITSVVLTAAPSDAVAGPTTGGTSITITGTGFFLPAGNMTVTIGGVAGTITSATTTTLVVTTPAHAAGTVNVVVTAPGGSATASNAFTYLNPPTIGQITLTAAPSDAVAGPMGGGTSVTITGSGFIANGTTVTFGSAAPSTPISVSPTSIVVLTPAIATQSSPVPVDTTVTTAGGSVTIGDPNSFTYDPLPTITSLSVQGGPAAGQNTITINGTGFITPQLSVTQGITTAVFGANPSAVVNVLTNTQLIAKVPAGTTGTTVNVSVGTPGGTATDPNSYVYGPPAFTSISSSSGPVTGGGSVTIVGNGFIAGLTQVDFGTAQVLPANVTVIDPQHLSLTVPESTGDAPGPVSLILTTPGGITTTPSNTYTYEPVLMSVQNDYDTVNGNTTVTLTGKGLSGATSVMFGSNAATGLTNNTNTSIQVTTPASAVYGFVNLSLTNIGGTSTLTNGFEYLVPLTYSSTLGLVPNQIGQASSGPGVGQIAVINPTGVAVATVPVSGTFGSITLPLPGNLSPGQNGCASGLPAHGSCIITINSSNIGADVASGEHFYIGGGLGVGTGGAFQYPIAISPLAPIVMSPPIDASGSLRTDVQEMFVAGCGHAYLQILNNSGSDVDNISVPAVSGLTFSPYCPGSLASGQSCFIDIDASGASPSATPTLFNVDYDGGAISLLAEIEANKNGLTQWPHGDTNGPPNPALGDPAFYPDHTTGYYDTTNCNLVKVYPGPGNASVVVLPWAASLTYQAASIPAPGATDTGLGQQNTLATLIAEQSQTSPNSGYPAGLCVTRTGGTNWYLPASCELGGNLDPACTNAGNSIYATDPVDFGPLLGGFTNLYWDSTEANANSANAVGTSCTPIVGGQCGTPESGPYPKSNILSIVNEIFCARAFTY